MGNNQSVASNFHKTTYATCTTTPENANSTGIYRLTGFENELVENWATDDPRLKRTRTSWDLFDHSACENPNKACMGRRCYRPDRTLGDYEWITYKQVKDTVLAVGSGLIHGQYVKTETFGDAGYEPATKLRLVGVFMKNRPEWIITDLTCCAFGMTLVPLYDTLGEDSLQAILEETRMTTVVLSYECAEILLKVTAARGKYELGTFVLVPEFDDIKRSKLETGILSSAQAQGIKIVHWDFLINVGASNPVTDLPLPSMDDVNTICYTSGTTGAPKGVMITHRNVVSNTAGTLRYPVAEQGCLTVSSDDVVLSFLPLAHVFERLVCSVVISSGASIGFYSGNVKQLMGDLKTLRPTVLVTVPRLLNRVHDTITATLSQKGILSSLMIRRAIDSKLKKVRNSADPSHYLWDSLVFGKIQESLGGRCRGMIVGGAAIDPEVHEKMKIFFSCPVVEGYGMTETFGPAFLQHWADTNASNVGGAFPSCEFKLVSVPEMNYYVSSPEPAGELYLRGNSIAVGYFRNVAQTRSTWDENGWLKTGDIARIEKPRNGLKIIDRAKTLFKLSQGEYVSPERVEAQYNLAPLVSMCFVNGKNDKDFLVGLITLEEEAVKRWMTAKGRKDVPKFINEELWHEVAGAKEMHDEVATQLREVEAKGVLKGFERIKQFHILPIQFTVENGLLTPTSKIKRLAVMQNYRDLIDSMYSAAKNE